MARLTSKIYKFGISFFKVNCMTVRFSVFNGEHHPRWKNFQMLIDEYGYLEPYSHDSKHKKPRKNRYMKLSEFMTEEFCLMKTKWLETYTSEYLNEEDEDCVGWRRPEDLKGDIFDDILSSGFIYQNDATVDTPDSYLIYKPN
jgi:hypothetical protein